MATIRRGALELDLPDNVAIVEEPPASHPRRRGADNAAQAPITAADVAQAFDEHLTVVDAVPLQITAAASPRRRGEPAVARPAIVRVDVAPDEHAVVLVEQDGYYSWLTGSKEIQRKTRRGPSSSVVTFEIPLDAQARAGPSKKRGPISDALIKPVTTIVFRFIARLAIGQLVKRLERSIETGLIKIDQPDAASWIRLTDPSSLLLPNAKRARVLLFIHGTFSSTRGGFGSFIATDAGKNFIGRAVAGYDLVLGFDHRTLSEDPLENAEQLLALLRSLPAGPGLDIDFITHSRGALVVRSLVEHLIPADDKLTLRNVVMVAGPNGGTLLASPPNWKTLVDLYTNLAVGICRLISLAAPPAATVTTILRESLQALAILVKAIVAEAADENRVPGLAAMVPGGSFITEINRSPTPDPAASASYYVVSSDFEVKGLSGPQELPTKLLRLLGDGFVDQLMREANDLVVNVKSMTTVDPAARGMVRNTFSLGENPETYHCSYFTNGSVLQAIESWLLEQAALAEPTDDGTVPPGEPPNDGGSEQATDASPPAGATGRQIPDLVQSWLLSQGLLAPVKTDPGTPAWLLALLKDYSPPVGEIAPQLSVLALANAILHQPLGPTSLVNPTDDGTVPPGEPPNDGGSEQATDASPPAGATGRQIPDLVQSWLLSQGLLAPVKTDPGTPAWLLALLKDYSPPVGEIVYQLPDFVDTNFTVIDALSSVGLATGQVQSGDHDFAVVRSLDAAGQITHYAFTPEEFMTMSAGVPPEISLIQAGALPASDSPVTSSIRFFPHRRPSIETPWASRAIVLLDGTPIGVAPAQEPSAEATRRRGEQTGVSEEVISDREPQQGDELATIQAYFRAETDSEISTKKDSLVLVDISLDVLGDAIGPSAQAKAAVIGADKPITVHVVPRSNLRVNGDQHATVPPPTREEPRSLTFSVTGTCPGPGRLMVIAGQGPVDLVKLVLDVVVVDAATTEAAPTQITAGLPPMPDSTKCDQLIITDNPTVVITGPADHQRQETITTRFGVRYQTESGNFLDSAETEPIRGDLLDYLTGLYRQLEKDWGTSAHDARRFHGALKTYGGQLFDELIPEKIQKALWDNRDRIKQIQVNSFDPLIPWEIVHLKEPNGTLPDDDLFLANLGLVRWVDGAGYPPSNVTVGRGRANAVVPEYPADSDWSLPETANELRFLGNKFGARRVDADEDTIVSLIKEPGQFDLLHFAGHGIASANDISNGSLVIQVRREGETWEPVSLTSATVKQRAKLLGGEGNRPLVFLNACQVGRGGYALTQVGGFAQAFLTAGAGIFVSTLWSVLDQPARVFTEEFYGKLLAGNTVAEATVAARRKCRAAGDPTWLAYVVYGRPDGRLTFG